MDFWDKAGDVFLKGRAAAAQNKDTMQRLFLHGQNQGQQLWLNHVSQGYGIDPATQPYLRPYGVEPDMTINNNHTLPVAQQEKGSGMMGVFAGVLLGATGLGAAGGALYALNQATGAVVTKPAVAAPQNYKIKVGFDEEKGFQFGNPEQVK